MAEELPTNVIDIKFERTIIQVWTTLIAGIPTLIMQTRRHVQMLPILRGISLRNPCAVSTLIPPSFFRGNMQSELMNTVSNAVPAQRVRILAKSELQPACDIPMSEELPAYCIDIEFERTTSEAVSLVRIQI